MLKKLILTHNRGIYLQDIKILIELTEEEKAQFDADASLAEPYKVVKGNKNKGLGENGKWYLQANGLVKMKIYNEETGNDEELVYYPEDVLQKIYEEEYLKAKEKGKDFYAESAWNYLEKCYTFDENGMRKYARNSTTTQTTWVYIAEGNEWRIEENQADNIDLITIDYMEDVSECAIPVEFMINLLEITGSKEFVNSFIKAVGTETYVEMKIYAKDYTTSSTVTKNMETETELTGSISYRIEKKVVKLTEIWESMNVTDTNGVVTGKENVLVETKREESWKTVSGSDGISYSITNRQDGEGISRTRITITNNSSEAVDVRIVRVDEQRRGNRV